MHTKNTLTIQFIDITEISLFSAYPCATAVMTRKALVDEEGLAKEMASRVVECFAPRTHQHESNAGLCNPSYALVL